MLILAALSILLSLSAGVIGLLVLLRNYRDAVNRRFFAVCLFAAIWSVSFVITFALFESSPTAQGRDVLDIMNKISYLSGLLVVFSIVIFSYYFPVKRESKALRYIIPLMVIGAGLSLTSGVAGVVSINAEGVYEITSGEQALLYVLIMAIGTMLVVFNLVKTRHDLDKLQKAQKRLLAISFGTSITVGVLLAVIAPLLAPQYKIDIISPIALLLFLVPVGAAVGRYKLFNFRKVLARGLVYMLVIGTLLLLYVGLGLLITVAFSGVFSDIQVGTLTLLFIFSIISALAFAPLKRIFDSNTKKLFFRDAYEPQNFLNDLNTSLVSLIDTSAIIKATSLLTEHYLSPSFVGFYVYKNAKELDKVFFTKEVSDEQQKNIQLTTKELSNKVTIISDVPSLNQKLKQRAVDANIEVVANLLSSEKENYRVGSIVLGPKKSGGLYDKQDYRVMEIIADELVIALQNALRFEEIQQFNITLQEKVDTATKELRGANEKLIALDQSKDEFISMASHQLRTPLTSVKGYVSMVLEGDVGKISAQQKKLLDQAYLSSQRMVYLIADLLNVSRLKTGKFIIESKPTQLADVIETELEQLKETAASRKLSLEYDKPKDFPMLNLDETKIRQVVMNFVDNAIYYTPAGGHIKVGLEDKGDIIDFTVTDDGIGVPKSEQHNLFNKFYRAGNAKKARPDGTGLGLFMAKKVVIAQGGNIIFKTAEGKGSTFGFSFEKKKLAAGVRTVSTIAEDAPAEDTPSKKKA